MADEQGDPSVLGQVKSGTDQLKDRIAAVWNWPQRHSDNKVSFSGQIGALSREMANDSRETLNNVFFGQPGSPPGMGTPMGPTPQAVQQGLEAMYGPSSPATGGNTLMGTNKGKDIQGNDGQSKDAQGNDGKAQDYGKPIKPEVSNDPPTKAEFQQSLKDAASRQSPDRGPDMGH